jgi:F-type H+/Na+-transporting ATPase subunit alpha
VRVAALDVTAQVISRFDSADKLSDEDRTAMIQIARTALAGFQLAPEAGSEPTAQADIKSKRANKEST